jgi:glycosyltransferase involved in cell wall biosynthesis
MVRNAGIRSSSAEYVAFLDADDEWLPGKLARQCEELLRDPAVGLVCSNALRRLDGTNGDPAPYFSSSTCHEGNAYLDLIRDNFVITSTAVLKRDALARCGLFREDDSVAGVEDYDLWLRIGRLFRVVYVPVPLAIYSDRAGTYRSSVSAVRVATSISTALVRLQQAIPSDHVLERRAAEDRVASLAAVAIRQSRRGSDRRVVALHVWRLLRARPLSLRAWRIVGLHVGRACLPWSPLARIAKR